MKSKINYKYIKSPLYRQIHSDGVLGGITPLGMLNLSFYATSHPIPENVSYYVDEKGNIDADTKEIVSHNGPVREVEFSIYMDQQSGKEIYEYLKSIYEPKVEQNKQENVTILTLEERIDKFNHALEYLKLDGHPDDINDSDSTFFSPDDIIFALEIASGQKNWFDYKDLMRDPEE